MFEAVVKEINNGLDTLPAKYTLKELGKKVGLSSNAVSDVLLKGTETNFTASVLFAKFINPDNYIEVATSWSVNHRRPENMKLILEFLSANRKLDTLKMYVNEMRSDCSKKNLCILDAYDLLHEFQSTLKVEESFLSKVEDLHETVPEAKFLKEMLKVYYYNDINEVGTMSMHLERASILLKEVKKGKLIEIYQVRINEMLSTSSLFNHCDWESARSHSEEIVKNFYFFGASYEARHYYRIGMSYFFQQPEMCLEYLEKAVQTYRAAGDEENAVALERSEMSIVKVRANMITDVSEITGTPSEAHYLIANGKTEQAKNVITKLKQNSPFTKYYAGMADENPFLLLESLKLLLNKGNRFYAKLPLEALESFPEASGLVNLLI
ncbi:AimR family lysis-lysogeny pheromone receptor [Rossellomorea sp. FS2]|uniref:AimR family lysis-lysogeny pheromone receptor n=1 Tax=Rossellomorea sp. FS2 TaxID=3391447 RepID=UPI003A4E3CD1